MFYIIRNKPTRRNKTYPLWLLFCDSLLSCKILSSWNIPFLCCPLVCLPSKLFSSSNHDPHSPNASEQRRVFLPVVRTYSNVSRAYWLKITSPTGSLLLGQRVARLLAEDDVTNWIFTIGPTYRAPIGGRWRHQLELYYWLGAPCSPHEPHNERVFLSTKPHDSTLLTHQLHCDKIFTNSCHGNILVSDGRCAGRHLGGTVLCSTVCVLVIKAVAWW